MLYSLSGQDAYEVLLENEAILFLGEVHILSEASYLIRIYKKPHQGLIEPTRHLQDENEQQPPLILNESMVNEIVPGRLEEPESNDTTTDT